MGGGPRGARWWPGGWIACGFFSFSSKPAAKLLVGGAILLSICCRGFKESLPHLSWARRQAIDPCVTGDFCPCLLRGEVGYGHFPALGVQPRPLLPFAQSLSSPSEDLWGLSPKPFEVRDHMLRFQFPHSVQQRLELRRWDIYTLRVSAITFHVA